MEHIGYCLSGGIHVTHEDGTERDVVAGEVYRILPGHDAWVVGDEPMCRSSSKARQLRKPS